MGIDPSCAAGGRPAQRAGGGFHSPPIIPPVLLLLPLLALALSCGGGGGGGGGQSAAQSGRLKASFKPAELYNVRAGDTFSVVELGGSQVPLDRVPLTGESFQTLTVEFKPGATYLFAVHSQGVPFVRTVVLPAQLEAAKAGGVLAVGELNALTTYFAGLLEVAVKGGRMAAGGSADQAARDLLARHFSAGVSTFSDLRFERVKSGAVQTTDTFRQHANRINILALYLEQAGALSAAPGATQASAMSELFAAIFDESSATNLLSRLSSPALPPFRSPDTTLASGRTFLEEVSGLFVSGEGVLTPAELRAVFYTPQKNAQLALVALQSRGLGGTVSGTASAGVGVQLLDGTTGAVLKSATTSAGGSYVFEGLSAGRYKVRPVLAGHVFKPSTYTVDFDENIRDTGFNFTSFLYVQGSQSVPAPEQVLAGIAYTSSNGATPLAGILALPKASAVAEGVAFGPGGNTTGTLAEPPVTFAGNAASASFKLEYH